MLFTYLRPFLATVTHVSVSIPSFMLLVLGLAGLAGTFLIEAFEKRPAPIAHQHPDLDDGVALVLVSFGSLAATTTGFLWGLVATALPVGWWTWLAKTLPDAAEAGGGQMVVNIQFAIASGATVGGLVFELSGYRATFE